jgi:hypothetical protein
VTKPRLGLSGFQELTSENIDIIKCYLKKYRYDTCDYNATNFFAWSHFMNVKWGMYRDRILFYNFNTQFMLYQLGEKFSPEEMFNVSTMIENEGCRGNFISVPEHYIENNPGINDHFEPVYDRCNSDYVYLSKKLTELSGRKLRKKKNLISQFMRLHGDYKVEVFESKYIDMCLELSHKWCKDHNDVCDDEKILELNVLERAARNYELTGLEGLLIFCDGKLIAFALFSELNEETVTVHFEKFDYAYKGSAQLINRETAIYLKDRYKYINREQDVCLEGLRKSKLSYDPEIIMPTYRLIRK